MSLEDEIKALREAVTANTALLSKVIAGREEALAAASKLSETTASTRRSAKDKDKDPPPAEDAPSSARGSNRRSSRSAEPDPTPEPEPEPEPAHASRTDAEKVAEIKTRFGAYINTKDKDLRKERVAVMSSVNDFFKVDRVSDVTGEDLDLALSFIGDLENGVMPSELDEEDAGQMV